MKLCIVGSGYVGLVAAACFANSGNRVASVDVDADKIEGLKRNELPIYEPGLQELVARNQADGRLRFSTDVAAGVRESDVVFIAVGTPQDEDGSADLRHVCAVAETIAANLNGYKVVVNKSTVPVGTADVVTSLIAARTTGDFAVVSNPEFLKEGTAVQDFKYPDRVVIGADDARARDIMARLYEPFTRTGNRVMFMDVRSAEMTKYAANAMLATRISFMNEMAGLCEQVGADVEMVRRGIGSDPRIGSKFLFPGVGFGGSCFPKDVRALIETGRQYDQALPVLRAVWETNERQKRHIVQRIVDHFGADLSGRTLALWGLAFKPETDDMREAPSLTIVEGLLERGASLRVTDPVAMDNARRLLGDRVTYVEDDYETLAGADALVVVTEWPEFRTPDLERMRAQLRQPVIFDGRNLYDPERMREAGFIHYAIGRPSPPLT